MENKLFDVGSDKIRFHHRNMIWEFQRPTNEVWERFELLKNSHVTINTKFVESELDDLDSKLFLFQKLFLAVYNLDMKHPVISRSTENWEEKIDTKFQKELASYFGEVNVKKTPTETICFGAISKDIIIEALHHWMIEDMQPNGDVHLSHIQKRLELTHTFNTPSAEEERKYRKLAQGKTLIERGSRESRKIVRNDLAGYRRLYDELISSASGYGVNGDLVFDASLIDAVHKMVAIDGLFAEEGADEIKN